MTEQLPAKLVLAVAAQHPDWTADQIANETRRRHQQPAPAPRERRTRADLLADATRTRDKLAAAARDRHGCIATAADSARTPTDGRVFEAIVVDILLMAGWWAWSFRPARTAKGWRTPLIGCKGGPDIYAVRDGRALAIECKTGTGRLSPEQELIGQHMPTPTEAFTYLVIRPSNIPDLVAAAT